VRGNSAAVAVQNLMVVHGSPCSNLDKRQREGFRVLAAAFN
jgi:hypothetical protein